jgi:hypothetical protein
MHQLGKRRLQPLVAVELIVAVELTLVAHAAMLVRREFVLNLTRKLSVFVG